MMQYFLSFIKNNTLIKNSAIFFAGMLIVNVGNYLYYLITARMLGVAEYGDLQSLLSVFLILGVPIATLSTLIIKYTARFKGEGRFDQMYGLFQYFSKNLLLYGLIVFVLVFLSNAFIASFLNLTQSFPVLILGAALCFSFLAVVNQGILQGAQKFKEVSVINIAGVFFKILFTVFLITAGLSLNGAMGALFLSVVATYAFSFWFVRFIFQYRKKSVPFSDRRIGASSGVIFLTLLSLTLFYTVDVILAKHFLSPELAGQYSGLSILGRVIFFLSGVIAAVMFPMSAEAHHKVNGENGKILKQALGLVGIISLLSLVVYFFLPKLLIIALLGNKFLVIAKDVGWFGLAMVLYSFINIFSQYFLSRNQTKFVYILLSGVVMQIILIGLWHESIAQIILIMNAVMFAVCGGLAFYFLKFHVAEKKLNISYVAE